MQEEPETAGVHRVTPLRGSRTVSEDEAAPTPPDDERTLVRRARDGDQDAVGALFDLHYAVVFRYLYTKTARREDAEDLAQEVFLRMIAALDRYQERGVPFRAFLMQIAANLARDFYRRHGAAPPSSSTDVAGFDIAGDDNPEETVAGQLAFNDVLAALSCLSTAEREVVELRFTAELSIAETAAALGKTQNNVKQLTFKALGKLRKALQ